METKTHFNSNPEVELVFGNKETAKFVVDYLTQHGQEFSFHLHPERSVEHGRTGFFVVVREDVARLIRALLRYEN